MTASTIEVGEPEKLGSLKDWAVAQEPPLDPELSATFKAYTEAIGEHNGRVAAWLGISVEELHGLPSREAREELDVAARARDEKPARQQAAGSMKGRIDTLPQTS